MQKELGFAAIGVTVFDLICICLSLGLDYWDFNETSVIKEFSGLWKQCIEYKTLTSLNVCLDIEDTTLYLPEYRAVRAMLFLGLFFVCGGVACIIVKLVAMKDKKELLFAAAGIYALAGICLLVGFAVYAAEIFKPVHDRIPDYQLHAGFAFCVISWLVTWGLAGISGAMVFVDNE